MQDLNRLSATEAVAAVASKKITSVELVEACLARIDAREPEVEAWVHIDREGALAQARQCDAQSGSGPLYGVPVGIKDIIDTKDMPTQYGSGIFRGHRPQYDAACVSLVRRAGGIILGKTVTTEFAMFQPNKTRNPHNPLYTPGGSSSGSAAAVADCHVPVAFATQTSGSIIRPASFCGAIGYKPSFNTFSPYGIKPQAPSLDTLGLITRTVADLGLMWEVLHGEASHVEQPALKYRVAVCRTPFWSEASAEERAMLRGAAQKLEQNGIEVEEIVMPDLFATLNDCHAQLMAYEAARNFVFEYDISRRDMLGETTRQSIEAGWRVTPDRYLAIRAIACKAQTEFNAICAGFDAVMAPSAPGEAPVIASTGNSVFNRMWTFLGVPAITIPAATGPNGLPLGVQFVGQVDSDLALLKFCRYAEDILKESFICK